jgi:MYXO-CTERM domain-containing protein
MADPTPKTPEPAPKPPVRSPDEIVKDIAEEREALKKSFDALAADLSETADAVRENLRERKEKVKRAAPIVGGVAVVGLLGAVLLRRRRR